MVDQPQEGTPSPEQLEEVVNTPVEPTTESFSGDKIVHEELTGPVVFKKQRAKVVAQRQDQSIPGTATFDRQRQKMKTVGMATVVESVYHQFPHKPAVSVVSRYFRNTDIGEDPYIRNYAMRGEWVVVDTGWLTATQVSVLVIANDKESKGPLHVGITDTEVIISTLLPGESIRLLPADCDVFRLYGDDEDTRCIVNALPR